MPKIVWTTKDWGIKCSRWLRRDNIGPKNHEKRSLLEAKRPPRYFQSLTIRSWHHSLPKERLEGTFKHSQKQYYGEDWLAHKFKGRVVESQKDSVDFDAYEGRFGGQVYRVVAWKSVPLWQTVLETFTGKAQENACKGFKEGNSEANAKG